MDHITVQDKVSGYTVTVHRGFTKEGKNQMEISLFRHPKDMFYGTAENIICDVPTWMGFVAVVDRLRNFAASQELSFQAERSEGGSPK